MLGGTDRIELVQHLLRIDRGPAVAGFDRREDDVPDPLGIVYDAAFAGFMRGAYVRADEWDHPHVSPIRGDLSGYPPAILVVGTHDPMLDSASVFAEKLEEAGNPSVELFVRDGMPHGFYFFPNLFQQEEDAYAAIRRFLARHLTGAGATVGAG